MTVIVGCFAIFLGAIWVIWPKVLRGWMAGKASGILFYALFFPFFFPAMHWAGQWGMRGWVGAFIAFWVIIYRCSGSLPTRTWP